jgi:hypothetical protein
MIMWGTISTGDELTGNFSYRACGHIDWRSSLVLSFGGKLVERHFGTFATKSATSRHLSVCSKFAGNHLRSGGERMGQAVTNMPLTSLKRLVGRQAVTKTGTSRNAIWAAQ